MPLDYYVWADRRRRPHVRRRHGLRRADGEEARPQDRASRRGRARGRRYSPRRRQGRRHHAHALRPLRQRRAVPERALPRAGHGDGIRDGPLHVPPPDQPRVRGRRRLAHGAPRVREAACSSTTAPTSSRPASRCTRSAATRRACSACASPRERGPVVLASDATHFYAHIDSRRVFRVLYNQGDMLEGYNTLERLAGRARARDPGPRPARARALSRRIREHGRLGRTRRSCRRASDRTRIMVHR